MVPSKLFSFIASLTLGLRVPSSILNGQIFVFSLFELQNKRQKKSFIQISTFSLLFPYTLTRAIVCVQGVSSTFFLCPDIFFCSLINLPPLLILPFFRSKKALFRMCKFPKIKNSVFFFEKNEKGPSGRNPIEVRLSYGNGV